MNAQEFIDEAKFSGEDQVDLNITKCLMEVKNHDIN